MAHDSGQAGVLGQEGIAPEEVRFARLDQTLRDIRELKKAVHDRLTFKGLSLAKDYVEGRFEITVELELVAVREGGIDVSNQVAPVLVRLKICHPQRMGLPVNDYVQLVYRHSGDDWDDQFVFIDNVEIVEGPEGVLPSVVGLQFLDNAECVGRGPLHLTLAPFTLGRGKTIAGSYEFIPIYAGREISISRLARPDRGGGQRDRYVIEDGSQAVDGVTDRRCELHRHLIMPQSCEVELPRFLFGSDHEMAAVSTGELSGGVLHLKNVSVGPFQLDMGRPKGSMIVVGELPIIVGR